MLNQNFFPTYYDLSLCFKIFTSFYYPTYATHSNQNQKKINECFILWQARVHEKFQETAALYTMHACVFLCTYTYINVPPTLSNSDLPLKATNMKKLKPKEREKVHIFGANFKMDVTFLEELSDHIFYVQIMST